MTNKSDLKKMANKLRAHSLRMTTAAGSGHPTSCMSMAELITGLFFSEMDEDDDIILSKGHAAPILWAAYAEAGHIPREDLLTLRKFTSNLEGHPTPNEPIIKVATGSLGQGLAAGVGQSLGMRLRKTGGRVFVVMGDGECAEGSVWEAANSAAYHKLNNLCAIVDVNRLGQSQATMFEHDIEQYRRRFDAFGWDTVVIDGHNIDEVVDALSRAGKGERPTAIIAKTFKGKGVSFLEDKDGWHGKPVPADKLDAALAELGDCEIELVSDVGVTRSMHPEVGEPAALNYNIGDMIATRKAFGDALVELGRSNRSIVAVDGDVKNSSMTKGFFDAFPERSFDAFIAEQLMVGMATGLSAEAFVPVVSTFAAFLTRAHDFIRMAEYSRANMLLVGSHSGVSIGEDGPSQMGLEDIPMFVSMSQSIVVYPSDAVSCGKLTYELAKQEGVRYMKTTRAKTPVLYDNSETFPIGGLKVLRSSAKDTALIVACGITVHEAIKAYEILHEQGVHVRVIDLYSVSPMDTEGLKKHATECKNKVIVVEDHYQGGVGPLVALAVGSIKHLYVKDIPRSGKPEELLHAYGIDADAIVSEVRQ